MIEKKEPERDLHVIFRDGTTSTYRVNKTDVKDSSLYFRTVDDDTHMIPLSAVKEIVAGDGKKKD